MNFKKYNVINKMSIEIQYNKNMEMCRVCVLPDSNLIALDELFVFNYNLLTNLNVKLDDGLPQYCCQRCSDAVKYFIEFREKSIEREHTLKDVIKAIKPDKDSTQQVNEAVNRDIKQELKIEEHDDFDCANDNIIYEHLAYEDENVNVKKENQEVTIEFKTKLKQEKVTKRKKLQRKVKSPAFLKNRKKDKSSGVVTVRKGHVRTVKEETCEDTLLLCGICKESFDEAKELVSHLETHKTSQHCSICYEKVFSWPQLFGHRIQHLPEEQRRCHLCKKKYQSACSLEFHYLNLHNEEELAKILRCNICTHTFDKPRKMRRHLISQHSNIRYYCDYCSKGYANKSSLKIHIKTHHTATTKFACDVCDYIAKSYGGLRTHKIKKHTVFNISCKKCHRIFMCQERFDKHSCKEKITICPICGMKRVGGNKQLQRHLESHKEVGRYKCDRCPATYKTSYALKTHIDQHNGNRTKKCEYCPATFFYASVLIKHRRTHTGEKPYVCKVCSKSFTGNNNLKVHMRVHGEFLINKKYKEEDNVDKD